MIGFYDFSQALRRYQNGNIRTDDAKILWAGITTAGNSGAEISRGDYATAMTQAYDELETQLTVPPVANKSSTIAYELYF